MLRRASEALTISIVLSLLSAGMAAADGGSSDTAIQAYVDEVMGAFSVPGAVVVVVNPDGTDVVLPRGVRCTEGEQRVTSHTSFALASLTKAFTATAAAALVDEGRLEWDTQVRQLIPEFRLGDPLAAERATLRDLLAHRTGVHGSDLTWLNDDGGIDTLLARLPLMKPSAEFRDRHVYSNVMVAVAGEMLARAAESTWAEVVTSRVLQPLGMSETTFGPPDAADSEVACPHLLTSERAVESQHVSATMVAPAMGLYTTGVDLARWLRFLAEGGAVDGGAPIGVKALRETWTPQSVVRAYGNADTPVRAYGLGWRVGSWRGHRCLSHGGGALGFTSQITVYPDDGVAVAVLANGATTPLPDIVSARASEIALALPQRDILERAKMMVAHIAKIQADAAAVRASHDPQSPRTLETTAYAGTYVNPLFGTLDVRVLDGRLSPRFHDLDLTVQHLHDDVFLLSHPYLGDLVATFQSTGDGHIASVSVSFGPPDGDVAFRRMTASTPNDTRD